jgi:hypothetical protein
MAAEPDPDFQGEGQTLSIDFPIDLILGQIEPAAQRNENVLGIQAAAKKKRNSGG